MARVWRLWRVNRNRTGLPGRYADHRPVRREDQAADLAGSTESVLSDKADKNEKNLDKGVAKMFKNFPPGAGKR